MHNTMKTVKQTTTKKTQHSAAVAGGLFGVRRRLHNRKQKTRYYSQVGIKYANQNSENRTRQRGTTEDMCSANKESRVLVPCRSLPNKNIGIKSGTFAALQICCDRSACVSVMIKVLFLPPRNLTLLIACCQ